MRQHHTSRADGYARLLNKFGFARVTCRTCGVDYGSHSGFDIHPSLEHHLLNSGLCYLENMKIKSPYPIEDCLTYAKGDLASHYRTFKTFNLGGAVEFLFSVSALTTGITIIHSTNKETKILLKPQEYENQCRMGELPSMQPGNTCKLVKLVENHPAIDFIILYNPGGSTSKSLFFVQVSSQKYSERSIDSRYNSINSKFQKSCFSDRTPSSVYSKLYSGSLVEYVYATTSSVVHSLFSPEICVHNHELSEGEIVVQIISLNEMTHPFTAKDIEVNSFAAWPVEYLNNSDAL